MDPKFRDVFTAAAGLWLREALAEIKPHAEQWEHIRKCMDGDGDVVVAYHAKERVICIYANDYAADTTALVYEQHAMPTESGFALSDIGTKQ
jgi:gentisate 1,2-dioxygenase